MRLNVVEYKTALILLAVSLSVVNMNAATEKKLHNFCINDTDGFAPESNLIFDAEGNLYGTTYLGGSHTVGTVFEMTPAGDGRWIEKKLHNFGSSRFDGFSPYAGVTMDSENNLFGTTEYGGTSGCGTVFEMSRDQEGHWTEKKLYNFRNDGVDGCGTRANVILDGVGNVYGTMADGGQYGKGIAFELSPNESGLWTEKVLHSFGNGSDGSFPSSVFTMDTSGNLYGTTGGGGDYGAGTVFELTSDGQGGWTEKKLHDFGINQTDGMHPSGGVTSDPDGNLYGTTSGGGSFRVGTAYQLSPNADGSWTETKLHNFGLYQGDGAYPSASLVRDSAGNLYSTTEDGGDYYGGVVFELSPNGRGGWTERKLHSFGLYPLDGMNPEGSLILDASGVLYGTASSGGDYTQYGLGCGTAFEIMP